MPAALLLDVSDPSDSSESSSESDSDKLSELLFSSSSSDSLSSGNLFDFFDDLPDDERPRKRPRVCIEKYCDETVQKLSDAKFIKAFRLQRDVVNKLIEEYSESEYFDGEDRGKPKIPPHVQMYSFLWFVGHEVATYEQTCHQFDLAPDTLYNIITRVADFVGSLAPRVIKWPDEEEMKVTEEHYLNKCNIPKVRGNIDGTHVRIDKPSEDPDSYINRKGFFSLQMQIVCDEKHLILDFFLGLAGTVHDGRAYRKSGILAKMAEKGKGGWLLGDCAYPCSKYTITPFKDNGHLLPYQRRFNKFLSKGRIDVEHTIGILKQRFRILYHVRLRPGMRRLKVIRACIVLHNIASKKDLDFLEPPIDTCRCQECRNTEAQTVSSDESEESDDDAEDDDLTGAQLREELAQRFM